jgi:DNA polymerase-3 subunit delta
VLLRLEQLGAHLERGMKTLYVLHGDEPLLMQEAVDALRHAARARGCEEREVFHVAGAHFDWSSVLGAAREMSLFASGKLIEIRLPSGKPGKDGAEALQRYAQRLAEGVVTLVILPRLDGAALKSAWFAALERAGAQVRIDAVARTGLPAWIAARLARQGQHVEDGPQGERALGFFADRVEGNLLAAHQEIQKLALLHPRGLLSSEAIEAAVLDVARYDIRQLCAAVLEGQVARALRILQGLRDEGETAVGVHWQLSNDLRDLAHVRAALDAGRPLPLALADARVYGARQQLIERAVLRLSAATLSRLLSVSSACDGILKGLVHEDWPREPWDALRRLVLMLLQASRQTVKPEGRKRPPSALALTAATH